MMTSTLPIPINELSVVLKERVDFKSDESTLIKENKVLAANTSDLYYYSYIFIPRSSHSPHRTIQFFNSCIQSLLKTNNDKLSTQLVKSTVKHLNMEKMDLKLQKRIQKTVEVINEAVDRYGLENVGFSFNGGKDCTVLLYLIYHVLFNRYSYEQISNFKLKTFYVLPKNFFENVEQFCLRMASHFNLELIKYSGDESMRDSLASFKETNPQIKAIFLGMRRTDPYGENQSFFTPTSNGWPEFMRVNPIIDWDYDDIWNFLKDDSPFPYCDLYKYGYTSIGSTEDTVPNPDLMDPDSPCGFKHARYLQDGKCERNGRFSFK